MDVKRIPLKPNNLKIKTKSNNYRQKSSIPDYFEELKKEQAELRRQRLSLNSVVSDNDTRILYVKNIDVGT